MQNLAVVSQQSGFHPTHCNTEGTKFHLFLWYVTTGVSSSIYEQTLKLISLCSCKDVRNEMLVKKVVIFQEICCLKPKK